ncbi:MAG: LysR family transcriptional regulator [Rhodobacteraceae bacterium]|nr:LysR family transcriptional regulator [Paracoccaceae bacterium]
MIERLEMFIALANERHFGRAAESLGITQPSLSAGIRHLEDQLGVQLVFRGSRFQGLTPEGQRVLDWARRIVGDVRTLREEMRAVRSGLSGNLRLGAIPTALPMVARLTAPFLARHPNVRMTILSRSSEEIREGIENLDLDAGLTYLDNDPLGRVTVVPLYRERYCLLVHRDSPLAGRAGIGWAEAAAEPLCLLTSDMQNRRILNQHLATAGFDPAPRVESNSSLALVAHVEAGGWASIVPEALAGTLARDGPVAAVPIADPGARHRVGLVAAVREPHTPVVTALIDAAARFGPGE